jgi:hypothetical protein
MRLKAVFQPPNDELLRAALADATARGSASIALRVATTLGDPVAVATALEAIEGGEDTADVREAQQLLDDMQPVKEVR